MVMRLVVAPLATWGARYASKTHTLWLMGAVDCDCQRGTALFDKLSRT